MAGKSLLDLVVENPNGLGENPPAAAAPKVFFDEYGQPYDEKGNRIEAKTQDPTLGESLLNIAESPAKMLVGAVTEPVNALQRLAENSVDENGKIAIPNPENEQNRQDVLTGLLSLYGGNAMNPAAAIPKGALASGVAREAADMAPIQGFRGSNQARPIDAPRSKYWASTSPEVASGYATSPYGFDAPNVTPANFSFENPMTVDAGGSYWAQIPHNGGTTTTDNLARLAEANGHDGLIVRNVVDEMAGNDLPADSILALKRGTVTSPTTGEVLFSDTGKPSIMGSALAGAEANQPVRAFHSTDAQFDRFDPAFTDEVGFHFGNKDQAQTRQMVKGGITSFINPWSDWRTIPVDIETQNPAALSRDVQHFTGERVANQLVRDGIAPPSILDDIAGASPEQQTKYVRDWLVSNGYDSVRYPNDFEGAGRPSYMALGTGNVKHAKTGDVLFAGAPFIPAGSNTLADVGLSAQNDQGPGDYLKKRMDQPYQPAPGEDFQYTPITPEIEQKLREFREPLMDRLMRQNPKMLRWEARQKVNELQEYKDYKNSIVKPQPFNPQP